MEHLQSGKCKLHSVLAPTHSSSTLGTRLVWLHNHCIHWLHYYWVVMQCVFGASTSEPIFLIYFYMVSPTSLLKPPMHAHMLACLHTPQNALVYLGNLTVLYKYTTKRKRYVHYTRNVNFPSLVRKVVGHDYLQSHTNNVNDSINNRISISAHNSSSIQ